MAELRIEEYMHFDPVTEQLGSDTNMNSKTQHTWLYREKPHDDIVKEVVEVVEKTPMTKWKNLEWARAGWDTELLRVLQAFLDHGRVTDDEKILNAKLPGAPVVVRYTPDNDEDEKPTPYWLCPQDYQDARVLIRPLSNTFRMRVYDVPPTVSVDDVRSEDLDLHGTSINRISVYPHQTKIALPLTEKYKSILVLQTYCSEEADISLKSDNNVVPFMCRFPFQYTQKT
ncbi:hypothetical protein BGW36DRAFT_431171 [Talaromyces proteolyticus]|uniref:Uncharacterized protein n=1 Tax=Talaromyces proteolyticus TaxID=1131652 RepID=A0AAD4KID0_9EURO|nr:uncharacterized protein BGW36DRAFT_431171 [Talaromyces proteolyticus]KAH8691927.1 hypothetical protein BGW36DRAFT_431171 [Talaromyces proteolyticus]